MSGDPGAEFEAAYAARSGVTVDWLHAHGRYAERCDCGEEMCEGWAMAHPQEDAIVEERLRSDRYHRSHSEQGSEDSSSDRCVQARRHDSVNQSGREV